MTQLVCNGGVVTSYYPDNVDVPSGDIIAGTRVIPWLLPKRLTDLTPYGVAPPSGEVDTRPYTAPVLTAKADLIAYAATARYYKQVAGINYMNAAIDTHPAEVQNVASILTGAQASSATQVTYKASSGFITLTIAQLTAMLAAMNAHVQACYAAEQQVDNGINANPATVGSMDQIDAVFAAITV
jgi:hypothetical protein